MGEIGKIAIGYVEIGIDSILDDGFLKSIPVVSQAVGIAKTCFNIRDSLFLQKINKFFYETDSTTQEERDKFVEEVCKKDRSFGFSIMSILEQSDRLVKTTLIGKIFKICIMGLITHQEALKLSDMVNRVFWDDLDWHLNGERTIELESKHLSSLYISGFYNINIDDSWDNLRKVKSHPISRYKYTENSYGEIIILINRGDYKEMKYNNLLIEESKIEILEKLYNKKKEK